MISSRGSLIRAIAISTRCARRARLPIEAPGSACRSGILNRRSKSPSGKGQVLGLHLVDVDAPALRGCADRGRAQHRRAEVDGEERRDSIASSLAWSGRASLMSIAPSPSCGPGHPAVAPRATIRRTAAADKARGLTGARAGSDHRAHVRFPAPRRRPLHPHLRRDPRLGGAHARQGRDPRERPGPDLRAACHADRTGREPDPCGAWPPSWRACGGAVGELPRIHRDRGGHGGGGRRRRHHRPDRGSGRDPLHLRGQRRARDVRRRRAGGGGTRGSPALGRALRRDRPGLRGSPRPRLGRALPGAGHGARHLLGALYVGRHGAAQGRAARPSRARAVGLCDGGRARLLRADRPGDRDDADVPRRGLPDGGDADLLRRLRRAAAPLRHRAADGRHRGRWGDERLYRADAFRRPVRPAGGDARALGRAQPEGGHLGHRAAAAVAQGEDRRLFRRRQAL